MSIRNEILTDILQATIAGGGGGSGSIVESNKLIETSSYLNQSPLVTDNAVPISYGDVAIPTPKISYSIDGSFTINVTGQYDFKALYQYGRTGSSGTSWLYVRLKINGLQVSNSGLAKITNSNDNIPIESNTTLNLLSGDVVTIEMWRGSEGVNAGGFISITPLLVGANPVASATMIVSDRTVK